MPLYDSTLRKLIVAGTPVPGALELFSQVLDGVEAAHFQNVMHRDLKPENLLVRLAEKRVAVADFGIAHFEEEDLFTTVETRAADRLGNYAYSAPEQRTRGRAVDHRADIFALGLILNELFTGEVAQGTGYRTIASVAPDFAYLDPLVAKMIRQNPAERPGSIRDIKDELMLRGAEFVAHQRLDQATMTVVPTIASNDPLAGVDVAAGEFYYEPGMLRFRLLPPPPPKWFDTLQGLQAFSFIDGLAEPRLVGRDGRGAFIQAGAHNVELIAGLVKQWVQSANSEYRKRLRHEAQEEERRQREQLAARQRRLAEEERGNERLRKALLQ
jgi:serine/threonine protein kinase